MRGTRAGGGAAQLVLGGNKAAKLQELLFGLAHQCYEDFALTAALATKAAHNPLEGVVERLCVGLQRGRVRGALCRDGLDKVEDFF